MNSVIKYKSGYKYQLTEDYTINTDIKLACDVKHKFIHLLKDGTLSVLSGYAWDGATCCPDFKSIIRGSLVHDAIYQLIRDGFLSKIYKGTADRLLQRICAEDGMSKIGAYIVYNSVKRFGGRSY